VKVSFKKGTIVSVSAIDSCWRFYAGAGGTTEPPVFGFALPVWHDAIIFVTDQTLVSIEMIENPTFHFIRTDDA